MSGMCILNMQSLKYTHIRLSRSHLCLTDVFLVFECTIKIGDWNTNRPSCTVRLQPMQMFEEIYKFGLIYVYL